MIAVTALAVGALSLGGCATKGFVQKLGVETQNDLTATGFGGSLGGVKISLRGLARTGCPAPRHAKRLTAAGQPAGNRQGS